MAKRYETKATFILVYNTQGWFSFPLFSVKPTPFSLFDSSKDQTNHYAWFFLPLNTVVYFSYRTKSFHIKKVIWILMAVLLA